MIKDTGFTIFGNYKTYQGQRNVFTTGPAKLDYEDYAIKCVGG